MRFRVEISDDAARVEVDATEKQLSNLRPFFVNFYAYMQSRTQLTFRRLRKGGGFRGVTWNWFKDQYTRKDGTTIPAQGGVPKVLGGGLVKGRLRGGGSGEADRVKSTSNLLRHRGIMYNAALGEMRMGKRRMTMDTPVKYAAYQNAMRPFQFFEVPDDLRVAERMFRKYLK